MTESLAEQNAEETITTPRPRTITIIAILMGVLALVSAITFALSFAPLALLRAGPADLSTSGFDSDSGPSLEGGPSPGGGIQRFSGGAGPDFQAGPGGSQGGIRSAGPGGALRTIGLGGPAFFIVRNVLGVLGIALAAVSAWFVWKQKRWALNLAIVLAVLFLLGTLPGLLLGGGRVFLGGFGLAQTGLDVLKVLLALPVILLSMLPSVRDFTS